MERRTVVRGAAWFCFGGFKLCIIRAVCMEVCLLSCFSSFLFLVFSAAREGSARTLCAWGTCDDTVCTTCAETIACVHIVTDGFDASAIEKMMVKNGRLELLVERNKSTTAIADEVSKFKATWICIPLLLFSHSVVLLKCTTPTPHCLG